MAEGSGAEAMYAGEPKSNLGNEEVAQPNVEDVKKNRDLLHQILKTGMQALGFSGGAMGIAGEIISAVDHNKLTSPMQRLHEFRSSPEYQGNKPSGASKEETEKLRSQR